MTMRKYGVAGALLALALASGGIVLAQTKAPFKDRWQDVPPKAPATQSAPATRAPAQELPVPLDQALYLIRSALLTLNDANRSGNYTVLRDLAAPDFQARNSAADLAGIFVNLRQRRIDLHGAALMAPQLAVAPGLDKNGMLRLTGHFPTQPQQINFDLVFQNVGGEWRLFGISIAMSDTAPQTQSSAQAPVPPPSR
jgi:hypothetical protein